MAVAACGQHAGRAACAAGALLDQIRLDHVLDRVALLGERRGQGFDADRPAAECSAMQPQIAAVHGVEAAIVDLEPLQRLVGDRRGRPTACRRPRRSRARGAAAGRRCAACRASAWRSPPRRPSAAAARARARRAARSVSSSSGCRTSSRSGMPKRSRSGVVIRPGARGGADQRERRQVDAIERAAGPSPIMRSSWKSSIAG